MIKPYLPALLLFPLVGFVFADWLPFAVDKHVTVQLPSQPTEVDFAKLAPGKNFQHTRLWALRAPEGAATY
jgi:hypothetical protein